MMLPGIYSLQQIFLNFGFSRSIVNRQPPALHFLPLQGQNLTRPGAEAG
jgi:hypothetical protein